MKEAPFCIVGQPSWQTYNFIAGWPPHSYATLYQRLETVLQRKQILSSVRFAPSCRSSVSQRRIPAERRINFCAIPGRHVAPDQKSMYKFGARFWFLGSRAFAPPE
jgi:hypothetical protein